MATANDSAAIDLEYALDIREFELVKAPIVGHTGVVEQNIEASVGFENLVAHALQLVVVGDIELMGGDPLLVMRA